VEARLSAPSRPAPRPTQPSLQWVVGLSRGAEREKGDAVHRLPSSAGLGMGRSYTPASSLCLYSHDIGGPLPLPFSPCLELNPDSLVVEPVV
jgi:hypothetical protein